MTTAPANLKAVRALLLGSLDIHENSSAYPTDLDPAEVGIVGDAAHRGGYHCGSDRVDSDDYSVRESPRDRSGLSGHASALDVGSFSNNGHTLRTFSAWLVQECARGAADCSAIREIIYSTDGTTVKRWDRLGKRSTGDSSHRWHTHISFHRDATKDGRDLSGPFRRYLALIGKPPAAAPKPTGKPAPGTPVKFPLPSGHYFGPADAGDDSVSGEYGRKFAGKLDRDWLKLWTEQLGRRGWSIGKGRTWLTKYGNDGRYGDEYRALIRAFQADQGLKVDGQLGPKTWDAAYRNPIR